MTGRNILDLLPDQTLRGDQLDAPGQMRALAWRSSGRRKDGSVIEIEGASTLMPGLAGMSHLYVMRARRTDIDEDNRRAQLASLVYRNTSEGMLVLDPKGFILDVNPAFVKLRGLHESEVIGRHVRILNSPCHDR